MPLLLDAPLAADLHPNLDRPMPPILRFTARLLGLTVSTGLLVACGQKGPLVLPSASASATPPSASAPASAAGSANPVHRSP